MDRFKTVIFFTILLAFFSANSFAGSSIFKIPLHQKWVTKLKKEKAITRRPYQFATVLVDNSVIYAGSAGGQFYALDTKKGNKVWHTKLLGGVYAEPIIDEDNVFVADRKGIVYALNKESGTIEWQVETGMEISAKPLVVDDTIYLATALRQIVAVDKLGRGKKWQTVKTGALPKMTLKGTSSPVYYNGNIYVGYADGLFVCYKAQDGSVIWSKQLANKSASFTDVDTTPLIYDNVIYISSADGKTFALNPSNGDAVWTIERGGANDLATDGTDLYISSGFGKLSAVSLKSGNLIWEQEFEGSELSSPSVKDGLIVLTATRDKIYVVNAKTGDIEYKRFLGKGSFGRPVIDGDTVYILTNSSSLFALQGS
jgi:outer membrane protein assembly factor BamB